MEVKMGGVKCDNDNCDYHNKEVKFDDYSDWIDKPCPECGENLLTRKDYNFCMRLHYTVKVIRMLRWINPFWYLGLLFKSETVRMDIEFNKDGTKTISHDKKI